VPQADDYRCWRRRIDFMDVAEQLVSIAALIPFLEHDEQPRAHGLEHAAAVVPLLFRRPARGRVEETWPRLGAVVIAGGGVSPRHGRRDHHRRGEER